MLPVTPASHALGSRRVHPRRAHLTCAPAPHRRRAASPQATTASAQRVWADSVQTLHRCAPVIRCVDFAILAACGPNDIDTCTYDAFGASSRTRRPPYISPTFVCAAPDVVTLPS